MISLISTGITECSNGPFVKIECAYSDALKVYNTISAVSESQFIGHASLCQKNVKCEQFLKVVASIGTQLDNNDILVIYFSGHADYRGEKLSLVFSDYSREDPSTNVYVENILELFDGKCFNILFILDCCYSGAATKNAIRKYVNKNIGVIASCGENNVSRFEKTGSIFTSAFCDSLCSLYKQGSEITVSNIARDMRASGYVETVVNNGAGTIGDITLVHQVANKSFNFFPDLFLRRLQTSDSLLREAFWYALADIPQSPAEKIFEKYFRSLNPSSDFYPECGWLIRRAIGSALSQFDSATKIIYKLFESDYWQEQCIGIIGARYKIKTDRVLFQKLLELIISKRIDTVDTVWLANLYMSDNPEYDFTFFLDTKLSSTSWGVIEIFKSLSNIDYNSYISKLFEFHVKEDIISDFYKYMDFSKTPDNKSKLLSKMKSEGKRGRLPEKVKSKFLLSAIYGTWRGHINLDIVDYFRTTPKTIVEMELINIMEVPDIDYKMALFDFFQNNTKLLIKHNKSVYWGLEDKNARVRASAIKAFKTIIFDASIIYQSVFDALYLPDYQPGRFDVFLECPKEFKQDFINKINDSSILNEGDILCIEKGLGI